MDDIAILGVILVIVGMWLWSVELMRLLRIKHPDLALTLTSPESRWRTQWRVARFLCTGQSFRLKDPALVRLGVAWLLCGIGAVVQLLVALLRELVK
jgi:hypothetical protein